MQLRQEKASDAPCSQNLFFFRTLSRSDVLLCSLLKLYWRQLSSYLIFMSTFLFISFFCRIDVDCVLFFSFTLMLDQLGRVFEIFPFVAFHFHLLISILFSGFPYLLFQKRTITVISEFCEVPAILQALLITVF